ncbi:hypothetical protein GVAV_003370 [Gurleya vavrai]
MLIHEEKKILCINFNTNKVSDKKIYLNVLYNKCLNFLTEDDNRCVDDFNFKDLIVSVKHHKFKCSISLENFISLNIVEKIDMYSFLFLYSNKISKFELYVFLSDIIEKESIEKKKLILSDIIEKESIKKNKLILSDILKNESIEKNKLFVIDVLAINNKKKKNDFQEPCTISSNFLNFEAIYAYQKRINTKNQQKILSQNCSKDSKTESLFYHISIYLKSLKYKSICTLVEYSTLINKQLEMYFRSKLFTIHVKYKKNIEVRISKNIFIYFNGIMKIKIYNNIDQKTYKIKFLFNKRNKRLSKIFFSHKNFLTKQQLGSYSIFKYNLTNLPVFFDMLIENRFCLNNIFTSHIVFDFYITKISLKIDFKFFDKYYEQLNFLEFFKNFMNINCNLINYKIYKYQQIGAYTYTIEQDCNIQKIHRLKEKFSTKNRDQSTFTDIFDLDCILNYFRLKKEIFDSKKTWKEDKNEPKKIYIFDFFDSIMRQIDQVILIIITEGNIVYIVSDIDIYNEKNYFLY